MELSYDWNCFRNLFFVANEEKDSSAIYVVIDREKVISVFGGQTDHHDWSGKSLDEVETAHPGRKVIALPVEKLELALQEAADCTHYHAQSEKVRSKFESSSKTHFLLEALESWWAKILPSAYGVFLRRSQGDSFEDVFLLVRAGKLESFHRPDLTWMRAEHARDSLHVVKYLSEKNLVPVQGVFFSDVEWREWGSNPQPWKSIAKSVRESRTQLVPFRWTIASMMATRAFFKL